MAVKLLLDTDIGTDIDDAICLSYLLANPDCNLLGITTVTGEPEKRAMLASSLCMLAGKDIPIYPGTSDPLIIEQLQKTASQAGSLNRWPHQDKFPKGEAVDFLRRTIRENPGEVVLLTIGPLTNIGILFALDPEIPSLLKSLVMMCGYFLHKVEGYSACEWNAKGDYHASEIVFRADVPVHRSVGIDVTSQVTLQSDEFKKKFSADIFKPLHDYAQHWYEHSKIITFHDPLAAVSIFREDVCTYQRGNVSIELSGEYPGRTNWHMDVNGRHEIAVTVNKNIFFQEYFSKF